MEEHNEIELDFWDLFRYLKRKVAVLLVAAAIGGVFGFVFTKMTAKPVYTADITVYLMSRQYEQTVVYTDLTMSAQFVTDYQVLIKSRSVTDAVIDKLDLDMTNEQVARMIDVSYETSSRVVKVSVTDSDPQRAADIANTLGVEGNEIVAQHMNLNSLTLVDEARVPTVPQIASAMKRAVLLAAVAAVLAAGILVLLRVLDDTIRTEEDVERYLGLSTLGIIPQAQELQPKAAPKTVKSAAKPKAAPKNQQGK